MLMFGAKRRDWKKNIFWPKPRIEPGTFRFEVSHSNQSATDGIKSCKKYLGIYKKFIQEQKFLEDFGEHLRGEQKNKSF